MHKDFKGWHVLCVKPRYEKKVDFLLKCSGLESFLPLVTTLSQWKDRKKKIQIPLFSSYVFIYINSKLDFYKALKIRGVYKYITFGEQYAKVTNKEIDLIKQLLNYDSISTNLAIKKTIPKKGTKMRIKCGPLNGLDCRVIKGRNQNQILVEVKSLHLNVVVKVHPNQLVEHSWN